MATLRLWLNDRQIKEISTKGGTTVTLVSQLRGTFFKRVVISSLTPKQRARDKKLDRK